MKTTITKEEIQFWMPIMGGIILTLIYIFDIRAAVYTKIDDLKTDMAVMRIEISQILENSKLKKVGIGDVNEREFSR